jgi:hypothetical protein
MNRRKYDVTIDTTDQIMQAIADCKDEDLRAVLIIIHSGFSQLNVKIDAVLKNEDQIKRIALNGSYDHHDEDHKEWREFRKTRPDGKCSYVVRMEKEEETLNNSKRSVFQTVIAHFLTATITLLGSALLAGIYMSVGK